jgi:hypothetical protein
VIRNSLIRELSKNKSLCTWLLQYRKLQVMFKVSPASLQTFIDTPNCVLQDRVQYSMVHIQNVFCDGRLQIINCVGTVRMQWTFCTVIIRCTETYWSLCTTKHYYTFMEPLLQCKSNKCYISWLFELGRNKMRCSQKINFLSCVVPLTY